MSKPKTKDNLLTEAEQAKVKAVLNTNQEKLLLYGLL